MLQRLGRSVDHAPVVRLEKTMMVFIADLLQLRVGTYASIIYPSIEPAETVHDGVHNMADLFANPDVGRHVVGSAAISPDLATDVIQRFLVARDQNHLRSEEHTSELQSLMRIPYAVFCLKKNKNHKR